MMLPWAKIGAGMAVAGLLAGVAVKMLKDAEAKGVLREQLRVLAADVSHYRDSIPAFRLGRDSANAIIASQAAQLVQRDTALGYARIAAHRATQAADGAIARARAAVADSVRADLETIIAAGDTARQEATACGLALDTCREARVTALAELDLYRARLGRADSLVARQDSALARLVPKVGQRVHLGCAAGPAVSWGTDGNLRPGLALTCGVAY